MLILFLPTQFGRHFWPNFSYVLGLRVDYLSPTIYLTDVLAFLLFAFVILNLFQDLRQRKILKRVQNDIFKNWELAAPIVFLLIGVILSKSPPAGLYGLGKFFEFCFLGFYTAGFIKKEENVQKVLLLFSIGVLLESFLALAQYIHQGSLNGIFYFFGERNFTSQTPGIANATINGSLVLRPYGTFPHPNVLAGYLVIAMTIIIFNFHPAKGGTIFNKISNFKNLIFLISLLVGTIALLLTMSRIAIILWIIIFFLWIFRNFNIKNSFQISNFKFQILMMVVVFSIFFLSPLHFRFSDLRLTDESVVAREQLLKTAIGMIQTHPVFGVGIHNFLQNVPQFQKLNTQVSLFGYLQPVHNIFFLIAAETGIVGFYFFAWFIGLTYKRILNKFIPHPLSFILLSVVLVLGMFDHYFLTLQQGQLLFAFVLGFCWSDK